LAAVSSAGAARCSSRCSAALHHVHLIGGDFVKVRATVAEPGWPRPDLEHFDSTLVTALTHR
jgi:hypothetical protein